LSLLVFGVYIVIPMSVRFSAGARNIAQFFLVFFFGAFCLWEGTAQAEFLRTGPEVYQSTGKRAKVIITQDPPGIFVLYGQPIDLQVFDPARIKKEDVLSHFFVRFDPQQNRYTGVLMGSREYRIGGNFTLKFNDVRLTVDNSNPYCSIVVETPNLPGAKPEILGLMGLSVIVNFNGEQAVALLEANQLSEYRGVVDPYTVRDGQIVVKDQAVGSNALGIAFEARNECLSDRARIVPGEDLRRLSDMKNREEGKKMLTSLLEVKKRNPLGGLLKLRVSQDSIIAFDPFNGVVNVVKKTTLSKQSLVICSIDEVRF
jgi:hypothetical protein